MSTLRLFQECTHHQHSVVEYLAPAPVMITVPALSCGVRCACNIFVSSVRLLSITSDHKVEMMNNPLRTLSQRDHHIRLNVDNIKPQSGSFSDGHNVIVGNCGHGERRDRHVAPPLASVLRNVVCIHPMLAKREPLQLKEMRANKSWLIALSRRDCMTKSKFNLVYSWNNVVICGRRKVVCGWSAVVCGRRKGRLRMAKGSPSLLAVVVRWV